MCQSTRRQQRLLLWMMGVYSWAEVVLQLLVWAAWEGRVACEVVWVAFLSLLAVEASLVNF